MKTARRLLHPLLMTSVVAVVAPVLMLTTSTAAAAAPPGTVDAMGDIWGDTGSIGE